MMTNNNSITCSLKEKIASSKLLKVRVDSLRAHDHNPPERTEENTALKNLRNEIRKYGVIEKVHYCADRCLLINGHRRWICCKQIGIEYLHGFAYFGLTDKELEELFLVLNTTARKFSSAEELHTYMRGGTISKSTLRSVKTVEYVGSFEGSDPDHFISTIRKARKSPNTYASGMSMFSNWTKKRSRTWRHKCLVWMTSVGNPWQLKYAIDEGADPAILLDAVKNGLPIRKDWGTESNEK